MVIKKKSYEKLDDINIKRVIDALESEIPITKKDACEILNISYNTTRLSKIINNFKADQKYRKSRRLKNRGKPASHLELQEMISSYLSGIPAIHIAKSLYRSPAFIKSHIDKIGVPTKVADGELFIPPDECVKYEFEIGEWVWFNDPHPNARGGKAGIITKDITDISVRAKREECKCYMIDYWCYIEWQDDFWVSWWPGLKGFKSWTTKLSYDLASIQHLMDKYELKKENL